MYYKKETVNADGKEIVSPVYTYLKGCLSAIDVKICVLEKERKILTRFL